MALRYLLDENLRGPLWAALRRANALRNANALEIVCVGEERDLPLGIADQDILRWTDENGYVLVSSDYTEASHIRERWSCSSSTR
ncbi:MAG TPA: hypothetical protein VKA15_23455 [Isosphaeraceae bacterium]|nr:hypothetical protein [Isosphaeraceae bacterium]